MVGSQIPVAPVVGGQTPAGFPGMVPAAPQAGPIFTNSAPTQQPVPAMASNDAPVASNNMGNAEPARVPVGFPGQPVAPGNVSVTPSLPGVPVNVPAVPDGATVVPAQPIVQQQGSVTVSPSSVPGFAHGGVQQ